jgi:hypothetical protein
MNIGGVLGTRGEAFLRRGGTVSRIVMCLYRNGGVCKEKGKGIVA